MRAERIGLVALGLLCGVMIAATIYHRREAATLRAEVSRLQRTANMPTPPTGAVTPERTPPPAATQPPPASPSQLTLEHIREELAAAGKIRMKIDERVATLLETHGEALLRVLRESWAQLTAQEKRSILFGVVSAEPPWILDLLDLAMGDADTRQDAGTLLEGYGFRNFAETSDYATWYAKYRGMPLADVARMNADECRARLATASIAELRSIIQSIRQAEGRTLSTKALTEAGVASAITPYLNARDMTMTFDCAMALSAIGDRRAVEAMIAAIKRDNSYNTIYGIGYFGLSKITGVRYDDSQDARWWDEWWTRNRHLYGP